MPVAVFVGTLIGRDPHGRLRVLLEFPDRAVLFRAGLVAHEHAPHRPVHETDFGLVLVAAWPRTGRAAEVEHRRERSNAMMQRRVSARVRLARYAFLQRAQMIRGLRAELVELAETTASLSADFVAASHWELFADTGACAGVFADAGTDVPADADAGVPADASASPNATARAPEVLQPTLLPAAAFETTWLADLRTGN